MGEGCYKNRGEIMRTLIGIDDTDNLESRGTGFQARMLGQALMETGLGELKSVTRHQLLVDPRIPYTSHNSSACLSVETNTDIETIIGFCSSYLEQHAAEGSDVGLCVAVHNKIDEQLMSYGARAKKEIISREEAERLAQQYHISLTAHTGTGIGVIGALAAVSLHASGNDGRFLWLPGLRETKASVYDLRTLLKKTSIDRCQTIEGETLDEHSRIAIGEWTKPVFLDYQSTLLVEEVKENDQIYWRTLPKEIVKQY